MLIDAITNDAEKALGLNISVFLHILNSKGYSDEEIFSAVKRCSQFILDEADKIAKEDIIGHTNIYSTIVMILMHTSLIASINTSKELAKSMGVSEEAVVQEGIVEMEAELRKSFKNKI